MNHVWSGSSFGFCGSSYFFINPNFPMCFLWFHDDLPWFPHGLPRVSIFRVCVACATTSCCGPLWCLWWQMWDMGGCGSLFETVQKQLTTYILAGDPYRWEVNKNPQLHSFDPSMDLRCLVWAQTSHIFTPSELDRYKWIRIWKMWFPDIFSWRWPPRVPCQIQGGEIPKIPFTQLS